MRYLITILFFALLLGCQAPTQDGSVAVIQNRIPEKVIETEETTEPAETVQIEILAKQFEFVPSDITVNKGDHVKLLIRSIDVTHGFKLNTPFADINEILEPNQEVVIEFTATEEGKYDFMCSVPCGSGHSKMRGVLIVE